MVRYVVGEEEKVIEEEKVEEARQVLSRVLQEAWKRDEFKAIRKRLEEIGRKIWKQQVKEALEVTGYAKELQARAREVQLDKRMEEAWGK